jgi:RimJ/RimL family protein N-acetyltransferase
MVDLPEFTTDRLKLKGVTEADVAVWTKHFVDYEVIRHLAAKVPWPYPDNGVRDFVMNQILPHQGKDRWVWGIYLKENPNELIGVVDLWRPGTPENRGFWLGKEFWGRGIMTEAVRPVMEYAFDALGFEVMIFANAKGNVRSRRIKEKSGARLVRVESADFVDPDFTEQEIWELTKEEWRKACRD